MSYMLRVERFLREITDIERLTGRQRTFLAFVIVAGIIIGIPFVAIYAVPKGSPLYSILIAGWGGCVIGLIIGLIRKVAKWLRKRRA